MHQPKINFEEKDEVFRIVCILRERNASGAGLLHRLLNNFAPTPENVRALYVFAVERLDTASGARVREVCTQWLESNNLPIPNCPKPRSLFEQFRDEGLMSQEDYEELMNTKL